MILISKPVDTNQRTETEIVALPEYHVCILVWSTKYIKETQKKLKVKSDGWVQMSVYTRPKPP